MNTDTDAQPAIRIITEPSPAPEVFLLSGPSLSSNKTEISFPEKENFFDIKVKQYLSKMETSKESENMSANLHR